MVECSFHELNGYGFESGCNRILEVTMTINETKNFKKNLFCAEKCKEIKNIKKILKEITFKSLTAAIIYAEWFLDT